MVGAGGKRMVGWEQAAAAPLPGTAVAQCWSGASGSDRGADNARAAVRQGVRLVLSPANRVYLDMKYDAGDRLGQDWAGPVEVRASYEWDPATLIDGVSERDVLGVEAPLWTETLATPAEVERMAFPRVAGAAAIGWW